MASRRILPGEEEARIAELERENAKLRRINAALMDRVERSTDLQGNAFSLFETAIALEGKVRERTADLELALGDLATSNAALSVARDAADEAQRRLRDAIESINEGFAIFDADDRLVLCNQTYLGLWPQVAARIQPGMTFDEITTLVRNDERSLGEMIAPDRWLSERMAQHVVASGGHVHALADGRWIQINELRTSEGGIVGVYTDITEAKAEDARERARELAEKSVMLQATLDNIAHGVCVYDGTRRLVAWNDPLMSLLGLPSDVMGAIGDHAALVARYGEPIVGWLGEGSAEAVVRRLQVGDRVLEVRRSAMPGGGMVLSFSDVSEALRAAEALRETNETLERRVDERTADIAAVNVKLQDEIGERLAVEDALREAKTVAEQANISKTRFLAAASHDLLQPLNAARLFVSALADRRLALPTRALVHQTGSALDSVEDLLEALLEISKLDAGAITPEIGDVRVDEILRSMRAEFAPFARERGLALTIDEPNLWARTDPRLLRRILQNLISNALRYTAEGSVSVTCRAQGDLLRIEVVDTGPGIAPEHHALIFEEFRRVGGATRDRGMGLGLAIVQRASRMLGHPIDLASAPGEGAIFGITVPMGSAQDVPSGASPRAVKAPLAGQSIVVIDNESSILDGMAALLAGWGCQVLTAGDVAEAIEAIDRSGARPGLIIADYHLDDGATGREAIEVLRGHVGRSVPAIVITADRTPELREQLQGEQLHVLQKPVKPAQLRALIGRLSA
ncbi:NahK/ErcS family hybrid sensor histidine kinase/response regulator [Sphingomonas crocodyli]|uniref:histidine kinase n=1 Tax=Sphingomonas crocodyli TaxID=1979270 RepID=A0A437M5V3_9SPHN|nr:NahK/ErcS family hybrid sensor histidine kinase/response regulator [Sphingomonas crocodyli]RVT93027.1 response regulator [Sphingomonas crocodyli]